MLVRNLFMLLTLLCLTACFREKETVYDAYIENKTTHHVTILPYKKGLVDLADTIRISAGNSFQIANGWRRGLNGRAGFNSDYFLNSDSVLVVFDDSLIVAHYKNDPGIYRERYYLFSSNRNIENLDAFRYDYYDRKKNSRFQTYTYTFTDADYDYAKN